MQPGVVGASKRNGTSPANVASSDAPCEPTCGARFVTVIVQVAGASSVTGFGAALIVDREIDAARGHHDEPELARHRVRRVGHGEAHRVSADARADLRRSGQAGRPALSERPAGSPPVAA